MKQCQQTTNSGGQCRAKPSSSGYCFTHDPAKGKERAAARRKGGQATAAPHFADADTLPKAVRTISDVFSVLDYTLKETVGLENSVNRNRLLVSISSGFIEAMKIGELEERLAAIESALKPRESRHRGN